MASTFGADLVAARQISGELANIRGAMDSLGTAFDEAGGAAGSSEVQGALGSFVKDSSDARKKLDGLLARSSGMLSGLAQGADQVDASLAGALTPGSPAGAAVAMSGGAR